MIKLTEEQARDLLWEGQAVDSANTNLLLDKVWEDEWHDDGKYSHKTLVFSYGSKNYMLEVSKTGSYYSEFYYDYELDCPEVKRVVKTIEVVDWERV